MLADYSSLFCLVSGQMLVTTKRLISFFVLENTFQLGGSTSKSQVSIAYVCCVVWNMTQASCSGHYIFSVKSYPCDNGKVYV